jgi:aerobic-type carbon monoxide dehydrogenase small subunit (CoxS/CutS family)
MYHRAVLVPLTFTVNGVSRSLDVTPTERLIDVIRDRLGLTGTKEGCSVGVCGACTVLVDGRVLSACLTLAYMVRDRQILTIEGLAVDGTLHPLQRAFITHGGFQCGFCTPGQILAAKALLDEHPAPSDAQITEGMLGNLCRCTGYYKIVESIKAAASEMTPAE